jgi:tetratricopeptide (TPR) repeat protein
MSLGQRIRQIRQSRGLTQQQLGGAELSKSFISLVERDRTRPSVATLGFIARRLSTSVDALMGLEGHLPETAAGSLLALSNESIRRRDFATAVRFLDVTKLIAGQYRLEESSLEAGLQLAELALEQQDLEEASRRGAEAQATAEAGRDFWRLGRALVMMAQVKMRLRDHGEAISLLQRALSVLKKAKASRDPVRVRALIYLGTCLVRLERYDDALQRYIEAARSDVAKHDPIQRGRALWGLGWICRRQGQVDNAKTYLLQAKDAFESAEELADLIRVLHNLGQVEHEAGHFREALRYFHHALRVVDRINSPLDRAATLTEIGRVHFSLKNLQEAEHFTRTGLEEARKAGDPVEVADAQLLLGRIRLVLGDVKTAVGLLKEALAAFRARRMESKAVEAAKEFGLALRARGAHAEAAEFLAQVLETSRSEATQAQS